MNKTYLNSLGIICSAGDNKEQIVNSFLSEKNCLTTSTNYHSPEPLQLGLYLGDLPKITTTESKWHTRNNQFALAAALQIQAQIESLKSRYTSDRIAVIIGTSTSGIGDNEPAFEQLDTDGNVPEHYNYHGQEMGATAEFIAQHFSLSGPVFGISTACSSGAKALASAQRLIRLGVCDAAIAGGVDTLCQLTVQGFSSLEAVSPEQCNPFSQNRKGINIGEGAALFVISEQQQGPYLAGTGESSDAHHISAPDPQGNGAIACMRAALKSADITPEQVDYINLHGTATLLNDQMESIAVDAVFGNTVLCSSTKPTTGHTLGAAGAIEAGIAWLMLDCDPDNYWLPIQQWDGEADDSLPKLNLVSSSKQANQLPQFILSNSFAFGGNNISLLLGREQ